MEKKNLSAFCLAFEKSEKQMNLGENNSIQYSMYGLSGRNIMVNIDKLENKNLKINYLLDLFCLWAQCRDRVDGKGERLVSYNLFIELFKYYPKTIIELVTLYPELGYWKDLNNLLVLLENEKKEYSLLIEKIEIMMI